MGCSLDAPRRRRVRRATPVHDLRGRPVNKSSRIDVHHRRDRLRVPITTTDQSALTDRAHHASSSGEPYRRARPPGSCRCTGTCCAGPVLPRDGDGVASRRRACSRGPRALWRAAGLCPTASSSRSCRPAPRRLAPPSAEADRAADAPAVRVDRLLSKRGDGATARSFFSRLSFGRRPGEVTTDRAPIYPRVLDDVVPSARHVVEQYANEVMEADPALLKVRRGPIGFGVSGSRATTERSGSDPLEPDAIVSWPAPARSHHG